MAAIKLLGLGTTDLLIKVCFVAKINKWYFQYKITSYKVYKLVNTRRSILLSLSLHYFFTSTNLRLPNLARKIICDGQ